MRKEPDRVGDHSGGAGGELYDLRGPRGGVVEVGTFG